MIGYYCKVFVVNQYAYYNSYELLRHAEVFIERNKTLINNKLNGVDFLIMPGMPTGCVEYFYIALVKKHGRGRGISGAVKQANLLHNINIYDKHDETLPLYSYSHRTMCGANKKNIVGFWCMKTLTQDKCTLNLNYLGGKHSYNIRNMEIFFGLQDTTGNEPVGVCIDNLLS
jgi:hypothetical protein